MYDLVVLGGGSGGLSVASAAARAGARVALIEKRHPSGESTCSASVPSKALVHAARLAHQVRGAERFGIRVSAPAVDFAAVMARVRSVARELAGTETAESLRAKGIDVYQGTPSFEAYDTVIVDGRTRVVGQRFVIATGSRPAAPDVPGLSEAGYLDSLSLWDLNELPETLVILGADPVGVELAQAFGRLGSKVKLLAGSDHILPGEDPEVSDFMESFLAAEGVTIKTGVELTRVEVRNGQKVVAFRDRVSKDTFEAAGTHILVAGARLANIEGLNLDAVGVHADPERGIEVDEHLQTSAQRIYAIGDVLHRHPFTHAAEREAAVVFQNAVLRVPRRVDYASLPSATFTDPEVATVGLTEEAARARHPEVRIVRARFSDLDRARIDGRTDGFAKVVATPAGKILGASVAGEDASMIVQEFVLAIEHGLTLIDIAQTVHAYPTYAGMAGVLANQFTVNRPEGGLVQTALRWFRGFKPRTDAEAGAAEASRREHEAPVGHAVHRGH